MGDRFLHRFAIIFSTVVVSLASINTNDPWAVAQTASSQKPKAKSTRFTPPILGKYACSASEYNSSTQMYEYKPKGSFTLLTGNAYRYNGFSKPSTGRYSFDATSGKIRFHGGYLDKGEATPVPDYKNRYFLVTPTLPDHRWTCSLVR